MLLCGLVVLAAGGLLLHMRLHPYSANGSNAVPFAAALLNIVLVPALFLSRRTLSYGYVINGMLVITGTVIMAHFAIVHRPAMLSLHSILLKTLFPYILILWGNLFIGKALFELELFGYDPNRIKAGKSHRYPHLGWWAVHLVTISGVYTLGNLWWP